MKAAAFTDRGSVRPDNQDNVFCSVKPVGTFPNLFAVADGMGGEKAGALASGIAIKQLVELIKASRRIKDISGMRKIIESVNQSIYDYALNHPEDNGMGTTLVATVIDKGTVYIANVGDSRAYIIDNSISQISHDHSYVQEMMDAGMMKRGSDDYLKKKKYLTRAVGTSPEIDPDFFEEQIQTGDRILLCSDGLTNMLDDEEIFTIVKFTPDINDAARKLIDKANQYGGLDNISVVLIECDGNEVR